MDNSERSSASPNGEPDTPQRNIAALDERADNTVFNYLATRSEELKILEMLRRKVRYTGLSYFTNFLRRFCRSPTTPWEMTITRQGNEGPTEQTRS